MKVEITKQGDMLNVVIEGVPLGCYARNVTMVEVIDAYYTLINSNNRSNINGM